MGGMAQIQAEFDTFKKLNYAIFIEDIPSCELNESNVKLTVFMMNIHI